MRSSKLKRYNKDSNYFSKNHRNHYHSPSIQQQKMSNRNYSQHVQSQTIARNPCSTELQIHNTSLAQSQPNITTASNQNQIVTLRWDPTGYKMLIAQAHQIKLLQYRSESQLRTSQKIDIQGHVEGFRFFDQNLALGFLGSGERSGKSCKIWDLRRMFNKEVVEIYFGEEEQWTLLEINQASQLITLGSDTQLRNYDYRKINKNKMEQICLVKTNYPVYDMKWYQLQNQLLITSGGSSGKGILNIFDKNLNNLLQKQLQFSPIISMSFSSKKPKQGKSTQQQSSNVQHQLQYQIPKLALLSQSNNLQIHQFPQFFCHKMISIPEQQNSISCHVSYEENYVAVVQEDQVLVYKMYPDKKLIKRNFNEEKTSSFDFFQYETPVAKILSQFSPICWHPFQNLLAYVNSTNRSKVSLWKF